MGIGSVAVYSEIDRDAPHVREADEAFLLGPAMPAESYLNVEKILEIAARRRGRGDPPRLRLPRRERRLRRAPVEEAGITFIGPPPKAIEAMGSKTRGARDHGRRPACRSSPARPSRSRTSTAAEEAGRRRSATRSPARRPAAAAARASASRMTRGRARGGLRGRRPRGREVLLRPDASTSSATSRTRATSRSRCSPTRTGNVIHLGERDCSIQRRHQKLIEEAPGPHVDDEMRERIGKIATDAAAAVGYRSRRHGRGPAGRRRVLLPRDEHPRPGRALRDRDGHRHRHRPRADPDRRRRAALDLARRTSSSAATRSSAGSTPRPPTRTSRPPPGGSRPTASRRAPACGSTPASRRAPR